MKIKIDIYNLVDSDTEYIIRFGPWGHKRASKLGHYVENFLLPLESEELEELSDSLVDDEDDSEATDLRDMIMYTMESIFEAESRKEGFGGKRPGEGLLKHLANTFMPFMHADIRNAMIEFDTNTGAWTMK